MIYNYLAQKLNELSGNNEYMPLIGGSDSQTQPTGSVGLKVIDGLKGNSVLSPNQVNTMRATGKGVMHYGNPFGVTGVNTAATIQNAGTATEVSNRYAGWLRGENDANVEPHRRQWILDQIDSGVLDGKELVYYKNTAVNHAKKLVEFINARRNGNMSSGSDSKMSSDVSVGPRGVPTKVGTELTILFNIKGKEVKVNATVTDLEDLSMFGSLLINEKEKTVSTYGSARIEYSIDLENKRTGKKYAFMVDAKGNVTQTAGAKTFIGGDTKIVGFVPPAYIESISVAKSNLQKLYDGYKIEYREKTQAKSFADQHVDNSKVLEEQIKAIMLDEKLSEQEKASIVNKLKEAADKYENKDC
jgi:hypothetical protein